MVTGALISVLLSFPILLLDLLIAFNTAIGDLAASSLFLPLLLYLGLAYVLKTESHPRTALGLAISGVVVSFLIILLILFLALILSALAEP
jgi:hypothetical protein